MNGETEENATTAGQLNADGLGCTECDPQIERDTSKETVSSPNEMLRELPADKAIDPVTVSARLLFASSTTLSSTGAALTSINPALASKICCAVGAIAVVPAAPIMKPFTARLAGLSGVWSTCGNGARMLATSANKCVRRLRPMGRRVAVPNKRRTKFWP